MRLQYHYGMSIPYDQTGRTHQKSRTRDALIAATRELLAEGITPTVEQAAASAEISRTTAYRYFPNQRSLLVAGHPEIEARSLLGENPPEDPHARLELATQALTRLTLESEAELRTMLRLSLEPDTGHDGQLLLRQGRVIGWLEEALSPLRGRLSEAAVRRLVLAIRSACGIEALVWLTDIGGLSRDEAVELMRWSARSLLQSSLSNVPAGSNGFQQ
jgi:AcrR family transcriptional regulator